MVCSLPPQAGCEGPTPHLACTLPGAQSSRTGQGAARAACSSGPGYSPGAGSVLSGFGIFATQQTLLSWTAAMSSLDALPTCHSHLPVPFDTGTVRAFVGVSPPDSSSDPVQRDQRLLPARFLRLICPRLTATMRWTSLAGCSLLKQRRHSGSPGVNPTAFDASRSTGSDIRGSTM